MKPILADAVYPRLLFMEYLGIGEAAFRTMLDNGLPTKKIAGRTYIIGRPAIDWLTTHDQSSTMEAAT